ncbi:MAG: class A beta-lactamase-related serine hydrolase [Ilumatobacter sp.]|nr:MAG: class A beta-lactamase-related serine hydrolase [Ilumatobacter sp.]
MVQRTLAVVLIAGLLAACAPARAASPPVPELVGPDPVPARAVSDPGADDEHAGGVTDLAVGVRTDRAADVAGDPTDPTDPIVELAGDPDATTDAPTVPGGWVAFDRSLERSIIANGSPAFSAAVMVNGELVRATGAGERRPGEPGSVTADTRFRVASISKIITAVVLLQLVDDGVIALDEPIGARLAEGLGLGPVGPSAGALTAEHLLSHTSGIGSFQGAFFGERGLSCTDVGRLALRAGGAPGGAMRYSNANSCLAHLLIEVLTGQDYTDVVYQRLLAPLGITGMRLADTYDVGPDEAQHFSRPGRNYMEALGGAGAWIASAADIARIVDALDPATPGWRPLSDQLLTQMRRPPLEHGGYGLGLILYPDGSVGHTGTLESTHAMVVNRPDGVTWAVLVNGEFPRDSAAIRPIVDRALAAAFPAG